MLLLQWCPPSPCPPLFLSSQEQLSHERSLYSHLEYEYHAAQRNLNEVTRTLHVREAELHHKEHSLAQHQGMVRVSCGRACQLGRGWGVGASSLGLVGWVWCRVEESCGVACNVCCRKAMLGHSR